MGDRSKHPVNLWLTDEEWDRLRSAFPEGLAYMLRKLGLREAARLERERERAKALRLPTP